MRKSIAVEDPFRNRSADDLDVCPTGKNGTSIPVRFEPDCLKGSIKMGPGMVSRLLLKICSKGIRK